jgi:hypothetical protein
MWERDAACVSIIFALTEHLQEADVDRHTRGMKGASDDAPVWVKLRGGNPP